MTEIVAAHLERFTKTARQVAHDYDVWCDHIDDRDPAKLEEIVAAALAACAREEAKWWLENTDRYRHSDQADRHMRCKGCDLCRRIAALERAAGEKAT